MTTATNIIVAIVASLDLAWKMALIVLIIGALMLIPFGFYKSNGGKKTYCKYCGLVFTRLVLLLNKGIEHIFTA